MCGERLAAQTPLCNFRRFGGGMGDRPSDSSPALGQFAYALRRLRAVSKRVFGAAADEHADGPVQARRIVLRPSGGARSQPDATKSAASSRSWRTLPMSVHPRLVSLVSYVPLHTHGRFPLSFVCMHIHDRKRVVATDQEREISGNTECTDKRLNAEGISRILPRAEPRRPASGSGCLLCDTR